MLIDRRLWLVVICLLLGACAAPQPAEPPAVIHEDAHGGGSIVAFSQSGQLLASGGWNGALRLWQMPGGALLRDWHAHQGTVNGIAFLADGRRLVTAGYDGALAEWGVDGTLIRRLATPAPVMHMAADTVRDRVLTGHRDGTVRLWRLSDFALLQEHALHQGAVKAVAIGPGAPRYASSGTDGRVYTWAESAAPLALAAPPGDAWTLAFAPDGHWLLGGSWFRLYRWDLQAGSLTVVPTRHHGIIKSIQYTADGKELATISRQTDSAVYFLDPVSGAITRRFQRHDLCGAYIAVSADGRYLATTSDDASVRIWVLGTPQHGDGQ